MIAAPPPLHAWLRTIPGIPADWPRGVLTAPATDTRRHADAATGHRAAVMVRAGGVM